MRVLANFAVAQLYFPDIKAGKCANPEWWQKVCKHNDIYIQSNEIHNAVALIKCLLVLRCQLYMFRTVTVHPQELLCRNCVCRLWYVVRNALSDTSSWYNVVPAGRISTYHSLHIQYLQRSS